MDDKCDKSTKESVRSGRKRPHRAAAVSYEQGAVEEDIQNAKKWKEEEKRKLFYCLKLYGHKDLKRIEKELPGRSKEDIRKFLIIIHSAARQKQTSQSNIKYWLNKSISEAEKNNNAKMNYCYQSAQIMKFLSIDRLLEAHPDHQKCGGIDFAAAYRMMYQALMGYPLQPVNQATADFIYDSLAEINDHKNFTFMGDLSDYLKKKYQKTGENDRNSDSSSVLESSKKKAVYVRKRQQKQEESDLGKSNLPLLKVVVAEDVSNPQTNSKCYSLAIGDGKQFSTVSTVVVPVASKGEESELEEAASHLWKNVEFNPLGIPRKLCTAPFNCEL